mmetsp:Transcript_152483/g.387425  ORF Transcript_152483/g.387425 Transcript_152483/m.387425 type:complete len:253 (+) Transcript_152483:3807-4565(+)
MIRRVHSLEACTDTQLKELLPACRQRARGRGEVDGVSGLDQFAICRSEHQPLVQGGDKRVKDGLEIALRLGLLRPSAVPVRRRHLAVAGKPSQSLCIDRRDKGAQNLLVPRSPDVVVSLEIARQAPQSSAIVMEPEARVEVAREPRGQRQRQEGEDAALGGLPTDWQRQRYHGHAGDCGAEAHGLWVRGEAAEPQPPSRLDLLPSASKLGLHVHKVEDLGRGGLRTQQVFCERCERLLRILECLQVAPHLHG